MAANRPKKTADNDFKSSTAAITAAGISISSPDSSLSTEPSATLTSSWVQEDKAETRKILQAFWKECILKDKQENINGFKTYLKRQLFRNSPDGEEIIDQIFKDAPLDFEKFCAAIQKFPLRFIHSMNKAEKLIPPKETKELSRHIEKKDINDLIGYMSEEKISAAISLRADTGDLVTPVIPENKSPYAMHSVGKVFTGMLALRMIQEGVISESDLKKPLDEDFIKQLPLSLQSHLRENKITLHQLMTHHSGLGDYLDNYTDSIRTALAAGKSPPKISQPEDFLQYAETRTFPIDTFHYSNLGILLVGLAIKTAYEKQYGTYDYDEILRRYIIDDADISTFSSKMPEGARHNTEDKIAPHIAGGPAGGYWTTAEDLAKFGKWIYEKCMADEKDTTNRPKLKKLMEDYGQEFYYPDRQRVEHGGTIPTACSEFSVSLATGAVVAILSDQPPPVALDLREKVQEKIVSAPVNPALTVSKTDTATPSSSPDLHSHRF